MPNPNDTRAPSGEENVIAKSGSNAYANSNFNSNTRDALARSLSYLPPPPCLPTTFNSRFFILASSVASR